MFCEEWILVTKSSASFFSSKERPACEGVLYPDVSRGCKSDVVVDKSCELTIKKSDELISMRQINYMMSGGIAWANVHAVPPLLCK